MNNKLLIIGFTFLLLILVIIFLLQNDKKEYNDKYTQPLGIDITSLTTEDE